MVLGRMGQEEEERKRKRKRKRKRMDPFMSGIGIRVAVGVGGERERGTFLGVLVAEIYRQSGCPREMGYSVIGMW